MSKTSVDHQTALLALSLHGWETVELSNGGKYQHRFVGGQYYTVSVVSPTAHPGLMEVFVSSATRLSSRAVDLVAHATVYSIPELLGTTAKNLEEHRQKPRGAPT